MRVRLGRIDRVITDFVCACIFIKSETLFRHEHAEWLRFERGLRRADGSRR